MLKKLFLVVSLILSACAVNAQNDYADKIVGTVGNHIILLSEVNYTYEGMMREAQGMAPVDGRCGVLRDLIAEKVLVEQAARDSILVTEEEVEAAVTERLAKVLYYDFGGNKEVMERTLNKSYYQIKEEYRPITRNQMLAERMRSELIKPITITPKEVEEFFGSIPPEGLSNVPAQVEVGEIVLNPEVSPEMEKITYEKVADIRRDIIENGKSFELMAQLYSEDGNSENGGMMDINRKSQNLDNRFIAAAFKLQNSEISPVFRSSFGYHIIQMLSRNGDDAKIRYIVVIPRSTEDDIRTASLKMDSVYNLVQSGKLSFGEAVNKVSNDDRSKNSGGMVMDMNTGSTVLTVENIADPQVAMAVGQLNVGEYSKPQPFQDSRNGPIKYRILYLKSRTEPHQINLRDDYSIIQRNALNRKQMNYLGKWLSENSSAYYIKIDPEFNSTCEELAIYRP